MKNFPTRAPVGMLLGAVFGFLSVIPIAAIYHHYQPPLERFYFPQYLGSTLAQTPIGTVTSLFNGRRTTRTYFVLMQNGRPLTRAMVLPPVHTLSVRYVIATPRIFGLWLQEQIYGGREFRELMQLPLVLWIAISMASLLAGVSVDFARRKQAREGVALRGPELLSRQQFNRVTKGDGFTLYVRK